MSSEIVGAAGQAANASGRRTLVGPLLAVAGGVLIIMGVALPWQDVTYALPDSVGRFVQSGLHVSEGVVAGLLGIVGIGAGIMWFTVSRRPGLWYALTVAVSGALVLDWAVRVSGQAGIGVLVSLLGALVGLAAVPFVATGSPARRLGVLALTIVAGGVGLILLMLIFRGSAHRYF
ncbi:MAG: hypothetical protein J2P15_16140 [Micromonosporaceae bacterium]|nr:hypothetical protein [Micromonosporaceae bacterium]